MILERALPFDHQLSCTIIDYRGPGKQRRIVANTNVPPIAPARNICCRHKLCVWHTKMFLILFRNILCPQQMFPSLRSMEIQHSLCVPRVCAPKKHHEQQCVRNNVSATMCPRLPGPYHQLSFSLSLFKFFMIVDDSFSRLTTRMIVHGSFSVSCFGNYMPDCFRDC